MSKKHYIYSTLASDVSYTTYKDGGADLPVVEGQILIAGGTGVAGKHLVTPQGVATPVSAENLARLRENEVFKLHEANGFIKVSDHKEDAEIVAADMTTRDESAPLVDADFEKPPAVVGGVETATEETAPGRNSRKA